MKLQKRKDALIKFKMFLRYLLLNVDTFRCFQEHNIPTPKFGVARTPEDAKKIASELDCVDLVVKAQVLYICSI